MSSFFRRTLGISRDSPDVESYDLDPDDPMQEHSTTAPLPHQGALAHSSSPVHVHYRSDYVHSYPPPSAQVHSNPVALPPSAPEQSYAAPRAAAHAVLHAPPSDVSEHPIPPTTVRDSSGTRESPAEPHFAEPNSIRPMVPAQEQRLRRETRDDTALPKHRLQRQTKTPRPFYEEPSKRDTLTLRLRNQLREEFQAREASFMNGQAQVLAEEKYKMEERIRIYQEEAALATQKANHDAEIAIQAIRAKAEQFLEEVRTNMGNDSKNREQELLEKLRGAEEDMDAIRRGSNDQAEALSRAQEEARQARQEAEEARAEAETMGLRLMKANTGRGPTEEQEYRDGSSRKKGKTVLRSELSDTEDETIMRLVGVSSQPRGTENEDDDMGLTPSSSQTPTRQQTIFPPPSSQAPLRQSCGGRDEDDDMGLMPSSIQAPNPRQHKISPLPSAQPRRGRDENDEMGAPPALSQQVTSPLQHTYRGGGGISLQPRVWPLSFCNLSGTHALEVEGAQESTYAWGPKVAATMKVETEGKRTVDPKSRIQPTLAHPEPIKMEIAQSAVRSLMNTLMHIKGDSEIKKVKLADLTEVELFDSGEGDGPQLDPMRPYFGKHFLKKGWHHTLRDLFIERMQQDYSPFSEQEEDNIGFMFDERIGRLRREWAHQMKMSGNGMEEIALRAAQNRASTRRVTLYDNRREVALGNVKKPDGSIDEGWRATLRLINKLGSQGMSSDESGWEGEGTRRRRVYVIKRRKWRSSETQNRLEIVDASMNTTNAFGRPRCGNAPRERIRSASGPLRSNSERKCPHARLAVAESTLSFHLNCSLDYFGLSEVFDTLSERIDTSVVGPGRLKYQPHTFGALRTNYSATRIYRCQLKARSTEASHIRIIKPVWWSQSWSWLSFVPLQPTYTSFPFEPLTWMPPIVPVEISVTNPPNGKEVKHMFRMHKDVASTWLKQEQLLVTAANKIRVKHGIFSTTPPLPSSFGFARAHKSHALAKQMASISRDWFGVLMGWLASIIAEVGISKHQRVHTENLPVPYWYWFLLNEGMPHHWLDGLRFSPVGLIGHDTLRAGIVFSWAEDQHSRPPIDFFYNHSIPMFFPWSIKEEQLIARDPSLSYLRPPNELIQNALSFLSKTPQSLPLAAFTMKCFLRADYDGPLKKETLHVLDARLASSFVLRIMTDLFMSQYTTLTEFTSMPGAMDQLADAMAAIPEDQRRAAEAAASVPQQVMLPKELQPIGVSNGVLLDWKDFFISRAKRHREKLSSASDLDKEAIENRRRRPPTKKTKMFVWEIIKTPGALTLYRHNQITRSAFEDILEDDVEHIYDPIINEWDFFPGFVKDPESQAENEVPSLRLAPPVAYRHFYDSDDNNSDDEENCFDAYNLNSLSDSGPPHALPSSRSSYQAMDVDEEGEIVEDNPDVSCDLEETLCYMYGWKRSHGYETFPGPANLLDWRGVEKILGFSSTPAAQKVEKLAITSFVTILAMGPLSSQKLSISLDDLNSKNRDPLCLSFDFRNILRLEDGVFIFHSLPSEACNWLLAVHSPEIAFYWVKMDVVHYYEVEFWLALHASL
ncbi:hypothetical protein HYPSUDRAFT_57310 [Hypholoma sublateritium FD-334 SS-4]|uniref:Uncharacterized protein n=1 Tax=Hypholoma sublateritium (strain FD-334 SS-4) TaxID=945553 RepID=A0A0D2KU30_HYPSF|nr:hypothetical protein HYPSUDRAFT_57310 [Hypholoma sublateritium FD-334 SS-4]